MSLNKTAIYLRQYNGWLFFELSRQDKRRFIIYLENVLNTASCTREVRRKRSVRGRAETIPATPYPKCLREVSRAGQISI